MDKAVSDGKNVLARGLTEEIAIVCLIWLKILMRVFSHCQPSEEFKCLTDYWRRCRDNNVDELKKLRRHGVYRIWDDFEQSLYVGQRPMKDNRD